jgi:hypothetical protein
MTGGALKLSIRQIAPARTLSCHVPAVFPLHVQDSAACGVRNLIGEPRHSVPYPERNAAFHSRPLVEVGLWQTSVFDESGHDATFLLRAWILCRCT